MKPDRPGLLAADRNPRISAFAAVRPGAVSRDDAPAERTEGRSRPCGTAPLPVRAERGLPGLLRRDLLSPRAHQRGGPRVAGVGLPRIPFEESPSATDTDRLLGARDPGGLHGDVRRPAALDRLQRRIDLGL